MMYQIGHPQVDKVIDDFYGIVRNLLSSLSPLTFIYNHEQFFMDQEPVDPRINTERIKNHFKKRGIQSISFEKGVDKNEIRAFLEIFEASNKYPDVDSMKKRLKTRRVNHLKINHFIFIKATEDDELVSRSALKSMSPELSEEAQTRSKELFLDMILESVLSEEIQKTVAMENMMSNPAEFSRNMVTADRAGFLENREKGVQPGQVLFHQLEVLKRDVEYNLSGKDDCNLSDVAAAVFDMKKQLISEIEEQKGAKVAYSNEDEIIELVNELTDNVLLDLLRDEYQAGKISTQRLAQIVRRLVPEADELKRLLPKIKTTLLEEGMQLEEYFKLVEELGKELQNEDITGILQSSAEKIGVSGEELIREIKKDPIHTSALVSLASEIRKSTGDEEALSDLLVDYIEKLGEEGKLEISREDLDKGDQHLRRVITDVQSKIFSQLREMNVSDDIAGQLEKRLNDRMDEVFERVKEDIIKTTAGSGENESLGGLSILEILAQNVGGDDELGEILDIIRIRARTEEVDVNSFKDIYARIVDEKKRITRKKRKQVMKEVLEPQAMATFLEQEMFRAKRYRLPFVVMAFTLVSARPNTEVPKGAVSQWYLENALLGRLTSVVRDSDVVGMFGENRIGIVLTNTPEGGGERTLRRCIRLIHSEPIRLNDVDYKFKIAGVHAEFDLTGEPDVKVFVHGLLNELMNLETRLKNIQSIM
jgi:ferritin-like metal-binding protein YciE